MFYAARHRFWPQNPPNPECKNRPFWPRLARRVSRVEGFGLIEVMVALLVVSLALLAASQAGRASILAVERQRDLTLAQLCAHNALAQQQLTQPWPELGTSQQSCTQRGQDFSVTLTVAATPNPSLRRVQVEVFAQQTGESSSDGGSSNKAADNTGPRIVSIVTLAGRY